MSRIARHLPDDPEAWDAPPFADVPAVPRRCLCSHSRSQHTRAEGQCWSPVCGCRSYRPKEQSQ